MDQLNGRRIYVIDIYQIEETGAALLGVKGGKTEEVFLSMASYLSRCSSHHKVP